MTSFLVIDQILTTSQKETQWHCFVRCAKHMQAGDPCCPECIRVHIFAAKTVQTYVARQVRFGFSQPKFTIESTGVKCCGARGLNPSLVYQLVKFQGFQKWEFIVVGTKKDIFYQKRLHSESKTTLY